MADWKQTAGLVSKTPPYWELLGAGFSHSQLGPRVRSLLVAAILCFVVVGCSEPPLVELPGPIVGSAESSPTEKTTAESATFAPVEFEAERSQQLQIAPKAKASPAKPHPPAPKPLPKPLAAKPPPKPEPQRPPVDPPSVDPPAQPQLPEANYPKAKSKNAGQSQSPDFFASNDPFLQSATQAANQNWPDGQQANPDEEAAYPTYHPSVVIDGWVDEQALYVRFDLQANGAFRASIVEGTGTPAFDAIALKVVRQWKWQPKRVRGRPVASTEVIRLRRSEDRPTHHF